LFLNCQLFLNQPCLKLILLLTWSPIIASFMFSNMNTHPSFLLAIWPYASLYSITILSGVSTQALFSMTLRKGYSEQKIWGKNCITFWMGILFIILSNKYICYLVIYINFVPFKAKQYYHILFNCWKISSPDALSPISTLPLKKTTTQNVPKWFSWLT
jgi:hypothetical protein